VEGRVVKTGPDFVEGGVLEKGALLVAIDPFDYRTALADRKAQLAEARAKLAEIAAERAGGSKLLVRDREQEKLRTRDVKRREELARRKVTSEKALDDSRLALSETRQRKIERERNIAQYDTRLNQQKAVIERLSVAVDQAQRDLDETELRAPFAGFLVDVSTELGKQVGKGDRVARVIDVGRLEARFQLSTEDFGRLLATGKWRGWPVRVTWKVGEKAYHFDAHIDRFRGEIEAAKGGIELYARIVGVGPETPLRPGAFVEITIKDREYRNVVQIPKSALHKGSNVYVALDGRLVPRRVEVVARSGGDVLVRGEFAAGAKIVTTRFPEIGPGIRVKVP
jgi:RND family efflux transporter MFP subunit